MMFLFLIFYHAGCKPASKTAPWDDNRIPAHPWPINVMITYFEFQGKLNKSKRKFIKSLKKGKKNVKGKSRKTS